MARHVVQRYMHPHEQWQNRETYVTRVGQIKYGRLVSGALVAFGQRNYAHRVQLNLHRVAEEQWPGKGTAPLSAPPRDDA